MLMDFAALVDKYQIDLQGGILHLGAHLAEEAPLYGNAPVVWVEANAGVLPKIEDVLRNFPTQRLVHALIYSDDDVELDFNITNYDGMSSSILTFGTHPEFSPDTVFVDKVRMASTTVDTLVDTHNVQASGLVMDLQGCEGPALRGATRLLPRISWVLTEINDQEVYIGATQVTELDAILSDFERVETYWVPGQGWGDGLWVRRS